MEISDSTHKKIREKIFFLIKKCTFAPTIYRMFEYVNRTSKFIIRPGPVAQLVTPIAIGADL